MESPLTLIKSRMPDSYLIVGGEGFLGHHVVEQIRKRNDGSRITVFDVIQRYHDNDVKYIIGDITSYDDVFKALEGITAVINVASPTVGHGKELMQKVNVGGTLNLIKAMQDRGVRKLVVTSSGSVISTGKAMTNVEEIQPYPDVAIDDYSASKQAQEKIVLAANGQRGLMTCTLRPSGIFGPGDRQLLTGLMEVPQKGQHVFQIGDNTSLMDFTYVGNVAYAHVLAAEKLTEGSDVCGQTFNVTNGTPIPFWDFANAVWFHTGHYIPHSKKFVIPFELAMVIGTISEAVYNIKALFIDKSKLVEGFSRYRVLHASTSRYFSIEKARKLLGYEPLVSIEEGIKLSVEYCLSLEKKMVNDSK